MKRLVTLSAFFTYALFADSTEITPLPPAPTNTTTPHRFSVGLDIFRQSYKGQDIWSNRVKYHTSYIGPRIAYEYIQPDSIYYGIEGAIADGSTRVNVDIKDRTSPFYNRTFKAKHLTSTWASAESRIGYTFENSSLSMIPYTGLGWVYCKVATHSKAYADWFYGIGGLHLNQKLGQQFDIGLNTNMTYAFNMRTHHVGTNKKQSCIGYGIGIPLTWHSVHLQYLNVRLEPFFQSIDMRANFYNIGTKLEFLFQF